MSTHSAQRSTHQTEQPADISLSVAELFELFGDEYTRRVYQTVTTQPRSGRAVAEAADVSRATAYRRLNELRDAGLVRTEMMICDDGHHKERFEAVATSLAIPLGGGFDTPVDAVDESVAH
ncbi:helix-turn-helix domain-containing protein [Haloplanus sp. C73]|uniref:helix-turn-helix domain-containing protein n=1 Tax=Haloplanus sp. C73 TaxID=3421641 RepID=UPI003EBCC6DD